MASGPSGSKWYWVAVVMATALTVFWVFQRSPPQKNSTVTVATNAATATASSAVPAAAAEPVDIAGSWNRSEAVALATALLEKKKWSQKEFGPRPYIHTLVGENNADANGQQATFVTFETAPQNFDCHACAPYLSFFEFDKRPNGWKLVDSELGVVQAGNFGSYSATELSVKALGNNTVGIFVGDGSTNQGVTVEVMRIFAKVDNKFRQVLFIQTGESESGQGWKSTITTVPAATGLDDLDIVRTQSDPKNPLGWANGPEESMDEVADSSGRIRPHDVFKFNGKQYVRTTH